MGEWWQFMIVGITACFIGSFVTQKEMAYECKNFEKTEIVGKWYECKPIDKR